MKVFTSLETSIPKKQHVASKSHFPKIYYKTIEAAQIKEKNNFGATFFIKVSCTSLRKCLIVANCSHNPESIKGSNSASLKQRKQT